MDGGEHGTRNSQDDLKCVCIKLRWHDERFEEERYGRLPKVKALSDECEKPRWADEGEDEAQEVAGEFDNGRPQTD